MYLPGNVRLGEHTAPRNIAWKKGKGRDPGGPEAVPVRFRNLRLRRRIRRRRAQTPVDALVVIGVLLVGGSILGLLILLG